MLSSLLTLLTTYYNVHFLLAERPIFPSRVQTEQVEHAMDCIETDDLSKNCIQDSITDAGGNADENVLPDEFSAALLVSLDPAIFALDFIKKIYSKNHKRSADMKEADIRFYILILEQLRLILPKVSPQVKEQATKFAVQWKSNMRVVSENFLMVLFFLLFLATYELGDFFEKKEILTLLFAVIQHKQAPELCRSLGFTTMVPSKFSTFTVDLCPNWFFWCRSLGFTNLECSKFSSFTINLGVNWFFHIWSSICLFTIL